MNSKLIIDEKNTNWIFLNQGGKLLTSNLHTETNTFVFDPGFKNTASCKSSVCFIDGEQGVLTYRDIAYKIYNPTISWMFIFASIQTVTQHIRKIKIHSNNKSIPKQRFRRDKELLNASKHTNHPMSQLMLLCSSLSGTLYQSFTSINKIRRKRHTSFSDHAYTVANILRHHQKQADCTR